MDAAMAQRVWLGVSPEGERHQIVLRLSAPVRRARGDWTCAISLGALDARIDEIAGMDSWQAIQLSIAHVAVRIRTFERRGWQFFFSDSHEVTSHTDLLPIIPRAATDESRGGVA